MTTTTDQSTDRTESHTTTPLRDEYVVLPPEGDKHAARERDPYDPDDWGAIVAGYPRDPIDLNARALQMRYRRERDHLDHEGRCRECRNHIIVSPSDPALEYGHATDANPSYCTHGRCSHRPDRVDPDHPRNQPTDGGWWWR